MAEDKKKVTIDEDAVAGMMQTVTDTSVQKNTT